ncbi:MAG: LysM domain-containing protein [Gemmatimonadales bacterium]
MTRTTISRSRIVLVAAAALMAWPLAAQDTTQARPSRHIVQAGETLWSLAQLYLGDPFLWPEIYRLNTLIIEDPHWIFPGEELLLAAADQTAAPITVAPADSTPPPVMPRDTVAAGDQAQQRPVLPGAAPELAPPPPPPPAQLNTPTVFARRAADRTSGLSDLSATFPYRAVRRGDFYASGFLTEGEDLPWARVLGSASRGRGIPRAGSSSAIQFESILLRAPEGATYHVGDSVLTAQLGPQVPQWGRIVIPTGIARVVTVAGRDIEAEVVSQFQRVADNQVALPIEPFRDPGARRPVAIEDGIMAEVITNRDGNPLDMQQGIVFLNRGRADGVVPGDQFEILRPTDANRPEGAPPEALGLLQIVHVREGSSSGMLLQVYGAGIRAGIPARLIRKMPS